MELLVPLLLLLRMTIARGGHDEEAALALLKW